MESRIRQRRTPEECNVYRTSHQSTPHSGGVQMFALSLDHITPSGVSRRAASVL
jgi:hypothetical protein